MTLTTTQRLTLPTAPQSSTARALAAVTVEEQTGLTTTTFTLQSAAALALVYKNGALLGSADVSVTGETVTLTSAAIAGDVFVVLYWGTT